VPEVIPMRAEPEDHLAGGGEMGARMRVLDWSKTPLGPCDTWPQGLKTIVSLLLNSRYPMFVFWGPRLVKLYNDAYSPILGAKHPWALGRPGPEVWPEIWQDIRPLVERALAGEATWSDDLMLFMHRRGFVEEVYFTFSYSPVRGESGGVEGMFCACTETTRRVLGERRLRTLHELAARPAEARTVADACALSAEILERNPFDVPFALIYLLDAEEGPIRLAASAGVPVAHAMRSTLAEGDTGGWPILAVAAARQARRLDDLAERFSERAPGPWPEAPSSALLVPLVDRGQDRSVGVLVLGISPRRVFDDDYRSWFEMAASQVGSSIANARASEAERARVEAMAEIDRAKTAFFSNVSHEFRTPLSLMLGPVEDVLARLPDQGRPEDRELLAVAHRNGLRLQKLVNTLLDFSRIEAGRLQASYEPTDLAAFTAAVASNFRSACERAGLRLVVDCATLPEAVYVDRDMWEKIVLNLLSNAFKFTFEGEIVVTLRAAEGAVELAVRDTGTGIPVTELPRLFERFHRVPDARGRTHEGTGIGLALVQELAKLHGGSVRVESVAGQGSRFAVSIPTGLAHLPADRIGVGRRPDPTAPGPSPYVEEALRWLPAGEPFEPAPLGDGSVSPIPARSPGAPDARPADARSRPRERVLWADDNADMRGYVRHLLGARYDVEAVSDGEAALRAARASRPSLVLSDVMMPKLDGVGLLRALRADPELRTVPVILLSARAGEEARIEGLEAGADDYLIKPFSARELLARVAAHLEMANLRRQSESAIRALNDALREADVRKDEFLATLSHELRTPLNTMVGWTRLLRSGTLDAADTQRALEIIERSVDHQSRLITDLLDISRIISGKLTLEMGNADLASIVRGVVDAVRPSADAAGITLTPLLPRQAVSVRGDAERLRQVAVNLLSNALKFTSAGGHVTVRLERAGTETRLEVSDTGQGISAEFLPHLFEQFSQADGASTRAQAGLGLGLAIVRHIVELHGGRVRAESAGEGKGATFTVDLPVAGPAQDRSADAPSARASPMPAPSDVAGVRVLIVDNDADCRGLFTEILARGRADVTAVETVREALSVARSARPDVIVCDIAMPGDDGFALIREVRSWPLDRGGAVPALALTAYARPEDRDATLAAGFQSYLSKPVEPQSLLEAVARLVSPTHA
jgi:signal transduction histidine kinase